MKKEYNHVLHAALKASEKSLELDRSGRYYSGESTRVRVRMLSSR